MSDSPRESAGGEPSDASQSPLAALDRLEHDAPPEQSRRAAASIHKVDLPAPKAGPDVVFSTLTLLAGGVIIALVLGVAIFLTATAAPSLAANKGNFFTSTKWELSNTSLNFGIAGMLWTTVVSSLIALVIAVPIALGVALLITHYAPPRIGRIVGFLVDLLAAVPSVVFGLWGIRVFAPVLAPFNEWVWSGPLGKLPLFAPGLRDGNLFTAAVVLAIMILPIITALSRDVFDQTPRDQIEAAWALGSTKWEMIRLAVLPYGRSGVIAAAMLGLGRALGETIAVMVILSSVPNFSFSIFSGGETFASKIASGSAEFGDKLPTGAFIAAGLVLFVLTFAVNAVARVVATSGGPRQKKGKKQ